MRARKIIQDTIISPSGHIERKHETIAKVIRADEYNNSCFIRYRDKDGYKSYTNAYVKINSRGVFDWFPEPGDAVAIEEIGDMVMIASLVVDYSRDIRSKNKLKQDIYSEDYTDTLCGSIF